MNYYSFHIGDYAAHTKHLSLFEDLAYRRLLDLYYMTEKALPLDVNQAARLIGMREYVAEVGNVLTDFFTKGTSGYESKRCEEEIERYQQKADRARRANLNRWLDQKSGLKSDQKSEVDSEKKLKPKFDPLSVADPKRIPPEKWAEWVEYRRSRKLSLAEATMRKQAAFLCDMASNGHFAAQIIEQSIRNGWQGLFEPDSKTSKASKFDPAAFLTKPKPVHGGADGQLISGECKRLA